MIGTEADIIVDFAASLLEEAKKSCASNVSAFVPNLTTYKLYLRARTGVFQVDGHDVIVIANVRVFQPGQGEFKHMLRLLKERASTHDWILKLENVQEQRFRAFLEREGFVFPGEWHCFGSGYWMAEDGNEKSVLATLPVW